MSYDPGDLIFDQDAFIDDFPPANKNFAFVCKISEVENFETETEEASSVQASSVQASPVQTSSVQASTVQPIDYTKQPRYKIALGWARKNSLFIYGSFILYIIFGAGLFYSIENLGHSQTVKILNESNCLSKNSFGIFLFYATSLATTVSYGSVYSCTIFGQILSVIYAMVGIPFVLIVLQKLGRSFLDQFLKLRLKMKKNLQVFCPIFFCVDEF